MAVRTPTLQDRREVENYFVCGEARYGGATLQSCHDHNSDKAFFGQSLKLPKPRCQGLWKEFLSFLQGQISKTSWKLAMLALT